MTAAARRQIISILSDGQPHEWGNMSRTVARTHAIPQKDVSST